MMHAYMKNRWYAVFFVTFTIVGKSCQVLFLKLYYIAT